MRTRSVTASTALLALGLGAACSEPPSYRLRWAVDGERLSFPSQCSTVGVFDVRVRTINDLNQVIDESSFPCFGENFADFDPDDPARLATAPGAAVSPGDYAVEVRGLSRDGAVWVDTAARSREISAAQIAGGDNYLADQKFDLCRPPPPEGAPLQAKVQDSFACRVEDLVCDCAALTVPEPGQRTPVLSGLDLPPPPQCLDGVDNDRDGLVDRADTACIGERFSNTVLEGSSVARADFSIGVSFFSGNPAATCTALANTAPFSTIRIELGAAVADAPDTYTYEVVDEVACNSTPYAFSLILPPGGYRVRVGLTSSAGGLVTRALQSPAFEVVEDAGGSLEFTADFKADDFNEAIEARASFVVGMFGSEDQTVRYCDPTDATQGFLTIDKFRLGLLDSHGAPVPMARLQDTTPLDGTVEVDCVAQNIRTESLTWGDYLVTVEALSAEGDVCFSSVGAGEPVAPGASVGLAPPRVSSEGSCRDCDTDDDCGDFVCDGGVCVAAVDQ